MTHPTEAEITRRLIGGWKLVSYVETDVESGQVSFPMGEGTTGFILYTPDGYMSAQMQAADRPDFADGDMFQGALEEYKAAGQTYLAYSGPFTVDAEKGTVTHDIKVSLFPNWAGRLQVRLVDFPEENRLRLRFEKPQLSNGRLKSAELIWQR